VARRSRLVVQVGLVVVPAVLALGATTASGDNGAPVSTVPPIAHGSPGVGKQLMTDSGSWSRDATVTYQWLRCNAYFADCTSIPGATTATYIVAPADVGHVLAARVTATGAAGSATALSNALGPAAARPPGLKHRPVIKGTKVVGQRLYETADRWTHSPSTFAVQWLRCSAGGTGCVRITAKLLRCADGSCSRVNSGTEWDYMLTAKDAGHCLRVRVGAWNGAGHITATSKATGIVTK
jgi:predicted actin-binding protein